MKIISVQSQFSEVFSRKMLCKHEATVRRTTMQKSDLNKADLRPRKFKTHAEHLFLGEQLLGTVSVCQKSVERLKL